MEMSKLSQTTRRQAVLAHMQDVVRLTGMYPALVLELDERHSSGGEDVVHVYLRGKEHPRTYTYSIDADSALAVYEDTVRALKQYL